MIGQCLGNALALQVADREPQVCRDAIAGEFESWRTGSLPPPRLQLGESAQLARELLRSYAEQQRYDGGHFAERMRELVMLRQIVRRKVETHLAIKQMRLGKSWRDSGSDSLDNGAAARAAPLGLMFPSQAGLRASAARELAQITHLGELPVSGAVLVASAVALAGRQQRIGSSTDFLDRLLAESPGVDPTFVTSLQALGHWMELEPDEALPRILRTGSVDKHTYPHEGLCPHVLPTVLWALYCFLKTPQDPWKTLCNTISAGGDVPPAAAMAGAFSGALAGWSNLPRELAACLTDRGICGLPELVTIAERAWEVSIRAAG